MVARYSEYQDACPTEGTAFDSNFQDQSGSLCSAYWVGLKTKSIKKSKQVTHNTNCLDHFVPALFLRSQCEQVTATMWFSNKVTLPGQTDGRFKEVTMVKMKSSWSFGLSRGILDTKDRFEENRTYQFAYVILSFENLQGNTVEDGNFLFMVNYWNRDLEIMRKETYNG